MRIDESTEDRMSEARTRSKKHAQDKRVPFLIRDDGMLYPNTPLVRRNPRYRPYFGDVNASLADRMRFLAGLSKRREVVYNPEPEAPFDLASAGVEEILLFAQEQYGRVLDPTKPLKKLREEVFALSQLPDQALTGDVPEADAVPTGALDDDDAAIKRAAALAAQAGVGLGGGLAQEPGRAIEPPVPLRGGRQPRGSNAGTARAAGTKAAEQAAA